MATISSSAGEERAGRYGPFAGPRDRSALEHSRGPPYRATMKAALDPRAAVVSLYRRNFQVHVIPKVNAMHRSVAEYGEYVATTPMNLSFDEFLENGRDLLNCTALGELADRADRLSGHVRQVRASLRAHRGAAEVPPSAE